jgi:hypothetical protein
VAGPAQGYRLVVYHRVLFRSAGEQFGLCMVELLPGARNAQDKVNPLNMLKKV